ncbi:glycosyltransferase family 61 protein [Sulfitobacter sp. HNIBRBA2951]|uniref:glycosyltransferase family 61 protein n=1 Tax=Sulfitobacter aquimarinus TaxID=3158557 RepID=UPI0032DF7A8D
MRKPDFLWREMDGAVIEGFGVSDHAQINDRSRAHVKTTLRRRRFSAPVEVNVLPAVADRAEFRKSAMLVDEKIVMSGASGWRALNAYRWENEAEDFDPEEKLQAFLLACQKKNKGSQLPVEQIFLENDLDFAVECRNTFNFYHFMVESLTQLTVLDEVGFQGRITFHYPNSEDKRRDFTSAFVEALFPEFAGRVFFERAPQDYGMVMTAFDLTVALAQAPQADVADLSKLMPKDAGDDLDLSTTAGRHLFNSNVVSSSLLALRARALKAIEGHDFSYLPKRFYVGRDMRNSRARPVDGEAQLVEHLARFDFEQVAFEHFTPLEQIALMAQAEVMISCHGAGFTNMLFANKDALVIELGTLQTAQERWSDFWPLANAAGCRYISFFADYNAEDPLIEPRFNVDGILPVRLSSKGTAQVVSFIVSALGHAPNMPNPASLAQLVRRLLRARLAQQAMTLMEAHQPMVRGSIDLMLLLADCHKDMGETQSELVVLEQACNLDPSRWQTLIRLFWCANSCDRPEVIRWALSVLERDFPKRYEAFVTNHEWVRFVA